MTAAEGQSLSKYRYLAELAHGGMGYVYLAAARGPSGFQKLVVLKELQASLAAEPEFLSMFLDEARLSAKLHHPNVVQTNEVGCEGNKYFIAMEYLEGQSLHRLIQAAGERIPLPTHLYFLIEMLNGLHYAHELKNFDRTPLGIVHRDVSPANLFITYTGQVKVVDFGIAKALDSSHQTRAGVLRGRAQYMAPEQVDKHHDRRADLFSAGVMLWEAIARKRMWADKNDLGILQLLLQGSIPSLREAKPDVPEALERICERALAVSPEDRYQTAAAMVTDLEEYLTSIHVTVSAKDGAQLISTEFAADRERLRALIEAQLRAPTLADAPEDAPEDKALPKVDYGHGFELRVIPAGERTPGAAELDVKPDAPRKRATVLVLALGAAAALGLGAMLVLRSPAPVVVRGPAASGMMAPAAVTPSAATARPSELPGTGGGVNPVTSPATPLSSPIAKPTKGVGTPKPKPATAPSASAIPEAPGTFSCTTYPWTRVLEGGKLLGTTPLYKVPLSPGTHVLTLENPDENVKTTYTVTIKSGESVSRSIALK